MQGSATKHGARKIEDCLGYPPTAVGSGGWAGTRDAAAADAAEAAAATSAAASDSASAAATSDGATSDAATNAATTSADTCPQNTAVAPSRRAIVCASLVLPPADLRPKW